MTHEFTGLRVILEIHTDKPFYDYTGRITKTLIYALVPELRIYHGVKGILSPIMISPPYTLGKNENSLGESVIPIFKEKNNGENKWELKPINLDGEYIFHIGTYSDLAEKISRALDSMKTPISIKIGEHIIFYKIEKITNITKNIIEKISSLNNRVRLYLKSPAQIFNVYHPTRLPKFSPTAVEVLMTPFMLSNNTYTITHQVLIEASTILGNLVETWYSLRTLKPLMVPFKGKRESALTGYITYINETNNKKILEKIQETLIVAEIMGIGRSRQNGFGTVIVKPE